VGLGILFNHKARPESVLSILLASERMWRVLKIFCLIKEEK
jgi:hypothetical protein